MSFDVDSLRRRPPGPKALIYLDQSTISDLACNPDFSELKALLKKGVEGDLLVCPWSLEHRAETYSAERWKEILDLGDELSEGLHFRNDDEIVSKELYAAAAGFTGKTPEISWREAFREDPHGLRADRYNDGLRVRVLFPPDEVDSTDATYMRSLEDESMTKIYEEVRKREYTFDEQAGREFEAMIYWKLGPLTDPKRYEVEVNQKTAAFMKEALSGTVNTSTGSAYGVATAAAARKGVTDHLVQKFPKVGEEIAEFVRSPDLGNMPSFRYPALFRAGLALTPNRKAKQGDGYDLSHLMKGLSRCDVVTADGGMAAMVTSFKLVPKDCRIFTSRDREGLTAAIKAIVDR